MSEFRIQNSESRMLKQISRFPFWILNSGFLILLAFVAGCPDQKSNTSREKPFAGQKVRIGVPAGLGFATSWKVPLNEWATQTGAEIALDEVAVTERPQPLASALGENAASLLLFPITRAGELTAANVLGTIPSASQAEGNLNWLDLTQGLREGVCSRDKQPAILPLSSPVLVLYYRDDLLKQAGLNPPETWDDYQKILDSLPQWAPGLTAVEPWNEEFRATMFLSRAAAFARHPGFYSFYFDIQTGAPLIDTPGFVRGLDVSLATLAKMPKEVQTYGPAECRRELLEGRAALAISYETGRDSPPLLFGPEAATSSAKQPAIQRGAKVSVGFARLPGSVEAYNLSRRDWESLPDNGVNQVTLTGFAGLAAIVSAKCTPLQAEASWNALASLTAGDVATPFPPGTRTPCRESQLTNSNAWVGQELQSDEGQKYLNVVGKSLRDKRVVAEIPVPGHAEFRRSLTAGISAALNGKSDSAKALAQVQDEWKDIVKQQNLSNKVSIRDAYRSALGLPRLD